VTRLRSLLALLLALVATSATAIDALPFRDRHEERRFQMLVEELRCMVCQNQNLADSDAFLAKDLRREVLEMMHAGKSDTEIRDFLVQRYGDFVLYNPPMKPVTWALWFGPLAIVLAGMAGIVAMIRRKARAVPAGATGEEDLP
jgi:cytochrome c-type biogenesis protein CcmH